MTREQVQQVQQEVRQAVDAVLTKHGLRLLSNRATYGDAEVRIALVMQSEAADDLAADWKQATRFTELENVAHGTTITLKGIAFTLKAFKRRRKNGVILRRVSDGAEFNCTCATALRALGLQS